MGNRENIFEKIEAYLADELSVEEKTSFEQEIATDTELAEEVALQKDTHKILDIFAQNAYKEKLKAIDAQMDTNAKGGKTIPFMQRLAKSRVYSMAAIILLLIVSSYLWLSVSLDANRMADQAFEPYMNMIDVKGDNDNIDQLLQDGIRDYKSGDFESAISALSKVIESDPEMSIASFYLGTALIANDEPAKAVSHLEKAKTSPYFAFITDWYIGLAHLKAGNEEEAKAIFEIIANDPDSDKQKEAENILNKMNSFWKNLPGI